MNQTALGEYASGINKQRIVTGGALNTSRAIIERLHLGPRDVGISTVDHPILQQAFQSYIIRIVETNPRLGCQIISVSHSQIHCQLLQATLLHVPARDAEGRLQEQRLLRPLRQAPQRRCGFRVVIELEREHPCYK